LLLPLEQQTPILNPLPCLVDDPALVPREPIEMNQPLCIVECSQENSIPKGANELGKGDGSQIGDQTMYLPIFFPWLVENGMCIMPSPTNGVILALLTFGLLSLRKLRIICITQQTHRTSTYPSHKRR